MNIYDTKSISYTQCGKSIGEIDYDVNVILPKCGQCTNPCQKETIFSILQHFKNNPLVKKSIMGKMLQVGMK